MSNFVVVDSATHRATRVDTRHSAAFGDDIGVTGLVPAEFAQALACYPIFLRRAVETGPLEPCALMGLRPDENLFLSEDGWDAPYIPLQRRSQPYQVRVEPSADGGAQLLLVLDMDSPRVQAAHGERLYLQDGTRSGHLDQASAMLSALVEGAQVAHAYGERLADLDLVEPVRLATTLVDGSQVLLEGLFAIKLDALRALSGPALQAMQADGYLELAWLQAASLAQVQGLIARKNRRLQRSI